MPANTATHPRTGQTMLPAPRVTYAYNPVCGCLICSNNGQIPKNHAESGHSFCYGLEHVPPSRIRFGP